MRKIIFVFLLLGLVPDISNATEFDPIQIFKCPKSEQFIKLRSLISGNNNGVTGWSDGYQDLPMVPDQPEIAKCDNGEFLWLSKENVIGQIPSVNGQATPKAWSNATQPELMSPTLYLEAIKRGYGDTPARMQNLRTRAWWRANDAVREKKQTDSPFITDSSLRENLETLAKQYDETKTDELMLKAEAQREMGKFDEALALLKAKVPKEYTAARDKILKWAKQKNAVVGILFQDKD